MTVETFSRRHASHAFDPDPSEHQHAVALAEIRLGRPLTLAERHVNIVGIDRDLNRGKKQLTLAIEKEKKRALNAYFRYQLPIKLRTTPQMLAVIGVLYRKGTLYAYREIHELAGVNLRSYAQSDAVDQMSQRLRAHLDQFQKKVATTAVNAEIGSYVELAATRQVLKMPGALNVAGQIVSGSMFGGIGDVYSENAGLFSSFTYSAVMDNATCDECAALDGEEFDSWEAIQAVLPDGGPNPDCYGEGRCRCRAVPSGLSDLGAVTGGEGLLPSPGEPLVADIGVTPFRAGEDTMIGFYDSAKFKQFETDVKQSADHYGVTVDKQQRVTGVWQGSEEPSVSLKVHDGELGVNAYAANLGKAYNQDGVLIFGERKSGDVLATFKTNVRSKAARNRVYKAMSDVGIDGGRMVKVGSSEQLQVIGSGTEFVAQLGKLSDQLGIKYESEVGNFNLLERDAGHYEQALRNFESSQGRSKLPGGTGGQGQPGGAAREGIARVGQEGTQPVALPQSDQLLAPLTTSDPLAAARALRKGRDVVLEHPDEIAVLLDDIAAIARDAASKGEAAPQYELGHVTVKGTNLFVTDSKGIPRIQMPQLKGQPTSGSKADLLARDKRGEVDIAPLFYQHLRDIAIRVRHEDRLVSHLRPTQNQLDGQKVSGIMDFVGGGGKIEGDIPVSRDGYIVDGHHRWAAEIGLDYKSGADAGLKMGVEVIDQDIVTILREANAFAKDYGIPQAGEFTPFTGSAFPAGRALPKNVLDDLAKAKKFPGIVDQASADEIRGFAPTISTENMRFLDQYGSDFLQMAKRRKLTGTDWPMTTPADTEALMAKALEVRPFATPAEVTGEASRIGFKTEDILTPAQLFKDLAFLEFKLGELPVVSRLVGYDVSFGLAGDIKLTLQNGTAQDIADLHRFYNNANLIQQQIQNRQQQAAQAALLTDPSAAVQALLAGPTLPPLTRTLQARLDPTHAPKLPNGVYIGTLDNKNQIAGVCRLTRQGGSIKCERAVPGQGWQTVSVPASVIAHSVALMPTEASVIVSGFHFSSVR